MCLENTVQRTRPGTSKANDYIHSEVSQRRVKVQARQLAAGQNRKGDSVNRDGRNRA